MKKKNVLIIIGIFSFVLMILGVSYGYFVYNKNVANISLNAGEILLSLSNINGSTSLSNVIPKSDYEGINSTDYIDFTVNGTVDTESILYELQLVPKNDNTLDSQYIKVCLTDQQNNIILLPFLYTELVNIENNNGKVLYQEIISSNNNEQTSYTKNFRLRMWIDEDYPEVASKTFAFDINIHAYNVDESKYKKVTFNTQDERVGLSKHVAVGEEYGELPVLTKEGYTFMGWNGKNLFDINNTDNAFSAYIDKGKIIYASDRKVVYLKCYLNTTYTVSRERLSQNEILVISYIDVYPEINASLLGYEAGQTIGEIGEKNKCDINYK